MVQPPHAERFGYVRTFGNHCFFINQGEIRRTDTRISAAVEQAEKHPSDMKFHDSILIRFVKQALRQGTDDIKPHTLCCVMNILNHLGGQVVKYICI